MSQPSTLTAIKKLRAATGAGVMEAKRALDKAKGNLEEAKKVITAAGIVKAEKQADRQAESGMVFAYIHHTQLSGTIIELNCETDFVAKTSDFQSLAKELALQANSMNPSSVDDLLNQEYIRDPQITVSELVKQTAAKVGENVKVKRFQRFQVGEKA